MFNLLVQGPFVAICFQHPIAAAAFHRAVGVEVDAEPTEIRKLAAFECVNKSCHVSACQYICSDDAAT